MAVKRPMIASQQHTTGTRSAARGLFIAVTIVAERAQDRLHVTRKVKHVRDIADRIDLRRRVPQGQKVVVGGRWRDRPMLMAANAAQLLARLNCSEALHPLDRKIILIERHKEK